MQLHLILYVLMVWYIGSCGIFTPRKITVTPSENEAGDPFMFESLLEGTGETFSVYNWQEYFYNECQYQNITLTGTVYSRDALINHLLQQHELYPDILVTWEKTEEVIREVDRIVLTNVTYSVTDADTVLFSGSSDFEIVRDTESLWTIRYWRDYADQPFFSPE